MSIVTDEYWEGHKEKIMKDLMIEKVPNFMYGEAASLFSKTYGKGICVNKKTNGAFLYQNIPKEFGENGVVCIYKRSIGTLAHELCHARQYQEGSKWFKKGFINRMRYSFFYYYYPTV